MEEVVSWQGHVNVSWEVTKISVRSSGSWLGGQYRFVLLQRVKQEHALEVDFLKAKWWNSSRILNGLIWKFVSILSGQSGFLCVTSLGNKRIPYTFWNTKICVVIWMLTSSRPLVLENWLDSWGSSTVYNHNSETFGNPGQQNFDMSAVFCISVPLL